MVGRVSKVEVESKVFPVLLYYPELSLTHVHSLVTAVVYNNNNTVICMVRHIQLDLRRRYNTMLK